MTPHLILALLLALIMAGCAGPISRQSLRLVDRQVSFTELRQDPDRYNGHHVLLGGLIVTVLNRSNGDEIELVQLPTDDNGEIRDTTASEGRFFALSSSFLDPAIYLPGQLMTIVGEVRGTKTMPLGEVEYTYPVISIREMHLWKPDELRRQPSIHFGIGVGTVIR